MSFLRALLRLLLQRTWRETSKTSSLARAPQRRRRQPQLAPGVWLPLTWKVLAAPHVPHLLPHNSLPCSHAPPLDAQGRPRWPRRRNCGQL